MGVNMGTLALDASPALCPGGELADLSDAKFELVNMLEGLILDSSPFCGTSARFTEPDERQNEQGHVLQTTYIVSPEPRPNFMPSFRQCWLCRELIEPVRLSRANEALHFISPRGWAPWKYASC